MRLLSLLAAFCATEGRRLANHISQLGDAAAATSRSEAIHDRRIPTQVDASSSEQQLRESSLRDIAASLLMSNPLSSFQAGPPNRAAGLQRPQQLRPQEAPRENRADERSSISSVKMETTAAEERAKAVAEAMEAEQPELNGIDLSKLAAMDIDASSGPSTFPLAAVVGQEAVKTALLLCGVNPKIGGVCISGSRGTAKSVMARSIHKLLPPIEVIKGSKFNIDPENAREMDSMLAEDLEADGKNFEDLEKEVIPTPFVQMPLDVLEDRLLGSVDVEQSLKKGTPVFEPGLLAKAHRGVLYVDEINLLPEDISNLILETLSTGWVTVEREGISVRHPCRPILVATFNPEEGDLREHLMDRIGICLNADAFQFDKDTRLEAMDNALAFSQNPAEFVKKYEETSSAMESSIVFAREYLKNIRLKPEQIKYLCESAIRAGCQGHRGEIFAAEAARGMAALNGEDRVGADDLKEAVKLCIIPRGTEIAAPPDDMMEQMQQPPPPPPPQEDMPPDEENQEEKEEEEEPPEPPDEEEQEDEAPAVPEEFMFDAEGVVLDPSLMAFASQAKSGASGKKGLIFSNERGRYIKPMIPKGKVKKLAVDATLRAAAPYQRVRREMAAERGEELKTVYIDEQDVRQKKMARKSGSLVIFVVDASGSMALNRMNAAKGAAINLLETAYQNRDQISLVVFQGNAAQVSLPPTKSTAMAQNRLERMPCGGGSPLAHALQQAAQVGVSAQKTDDIGDVLVVCISDGRANVPLKYATDGPPEEGEEPMSKEDLKQEVLDNARKLGGLPGFKLLILDTENKFVSTGVAKEIADAGRGRYHYIPKAGSEAVADVAKAAIAAARR